MSRNLLASLILMLSLSGCASSPFFRGANNESYIDPGSQREWYPLPGSGEQITVINTTSGMQSPATVIDAYYAASGRTCSLYTETGGMYPTGLACRDADRWLALPFIVNPDARPNNS